MSKSIQCVLTLCLLVGTMPLAWSQTEGHEHHHTIPTMSEAANESGKHHGDASDANNTPSYTDPLLPQPTAAEHEAAFPDLGGMDLRRHMRTPLLGYLLIDQLEWQDADQSDAGAWDISGWLGYDFNRLWLRSEGERKDGEFEAAEAHLLYGRAFARWWNLVAGIRQDFEPGPGRTYAALGVQGLAPYWFETQFTLYAGEAGQSGARLELEYEQLLTNRLVLQPRVEINAWSRSDLQHGIGAGISGVEAGLRLRYEIRREFAPYIGLNYAQVFGNTADLRNSADEDTNELRAVAGLRIWF